MPIEQSKHSHYEKAIVNRGRTYSESIYPWKVYCDFCPTAAYKFGETAGDAADEARRDGFVTIPNKVVVLPSKWACKTCKEAMDKGSFVAKKPTISTDDRNPAKDNTQTTFEQAPLVDAMKQASAPRKPARVPAPPLRRNVSR